MFRQKIKQDKEGKTDRSGMEPFHKGRHGGGDI